MKLLIISKRTLRIIIAAFILILISVVMKTVYNKAEPTFYSDPYYQGVTDSNTIAFACNIDWGNEHIPDMLEIFNKNKIKITFFPTGKWAEKNEEMLMEIYKNQHEIGNHGYSHADYDKLGYERNKEEIEKADNIINNILKIKPQYFAPPSGAFNDSTIKAAKDLGYKTILWSIDTIDWRQDSTRDIIIDRVVKKAHNSAIVLMHPTAETVKALPEIINDLHKQGYKIGTITDVMKNN